MPATLWFFDKSKCQNHGLNGLTDSTDKARKEISEISKSAAISGSDTILFIDARNIFRQVTRALREFTDEHIQNIATIVRLYRGENHRLQALLAKYQTQADEAAAQAQRQAIEVEQIRKAKPTDDKALKRWEKQLEEAEKQWKALTEKQNYYLGHLNWLNERFPKGVYEDVTGLCKAATLQEIEEQDYSLNPGRYVGVVIEEDGLTEEEFLAEMKDRHTALNALNSKARELEALINQNLTGIG